VLRTLADISATAGSGGVIKENIAKLKAETPARLASSALRQGQLDNRRPAITGWAGGEQGATLVGIDNPILAMPCRA